jgi:hypothetical protein
MKQEDTHQSQSLLGPVGQSRVQTSLLLRHAAICNNSCLCRVCKQILFLSNKVRLKQDETFHSLHSLLISDTPRVEAVKAIVDTTFVAAENLCLLEIEVSSYSNRFVM